MIDFSAFPLGRRQDMLAMLQIMEAAGVTDLRFARQEIQESIRRDAVREKSAAAKARRGIRRAGGRFHRGELVQAETTCSLCGCRALIQRVNCCRSTMVGGSWRTSIICCNIDCRHVEYSTKTVREFR